MNEPKIAPLRPEPAAAPVAKAQAVLQAASSYRYLLALAPPVPPEFYGEVKFTYRAGQFVLATVEETLKA